MIIIISVGVDVKRWIGMKNWIQLEEFLHW